VLPGLALPIVDNQNPEIEDTMANRQMTINDLQITAMKTKDRGT
jgi:hypothetical protein